LTELPATRPSSDEPAGRSCTEPAGLGIVAALRAEARALGVPRQRRTVRNGTLVAVTGIGYEAAARGARQLVGAGCHALLSWGLAGALDPTLAPGAILVPDEVVLAGHEHRLRTTCGWRERVLRVLAADWPVERGTLLTSPRPLAAAADKASAFRQTAAAAVDMESFAVAEVALAHGLAFLAVRVVVDRASDEVPHALEGVARASGELAIGRLLARLLAQPSSITQLAHLARCYRAARRSLRGIARSGALLEYVSR
jgi:adenosylhomocysteine nucleosidase